MKRVPFIVLVGLAVLALSTGSALCHRSGPEGGAGDFDIYVSPSMIVQSAPCPWITIHTDVPAGLVASCYVVVEEMVLDELHTYADSLGNLVVKVPFEDIASLASPSSTDVTLVLGDDRRATDTISVKN
jgi:hypothetical protein